MVIGIKDLNNIKLQEQFDITHRNSPLSYDKYLQVIIDACDLLDQTLMVTTRTEQLNINKSTSRHKEGKFLANDYSSFQHVLNPNSFGDLDEEDSSEDENQDFEINNMNCKNFGPSVNRETWNSFSDQDKEAWNMISPSARKSIFDYAMKSGKFHENKPSNNK